MFLSPLNTCLSADIPNPPRKRSFRNHSTPTSPRANPPLSENEVFKNSTLNTYLSAGRLNTPENEVFDHSTPTFRQAGSTPLENEVFDHSTLNTKNSTLSNTFYVFE